MWRRLFLDAIPQWRLAALVMIPTLLVSLVAGRLAMLVLARTIHRLLQDAVATSSPFIRTPLRLIGLMTFVIVFSILVFPAFEVAALHPRIGVRLRTLSAWTFASGLRVLLIAVFAFAVIRLVAIGVKRFEHDVNFGTGLDALERAKRARTLGGILTSMSTVLVVTIAVLMILHEFRVDISPAVTGAGIVGVAFGFGAQGLVKDLIGGFFLIFDNQIRVGDAVAINGTGGTVEAINLRTTVLRDEDGTVHIFPNGGITTLANRSLHFSYYVVNLPLAYGEDTDTVMAILEDIAAGMRAEDAYVPFMLEPMEVIGVDAFDETAVRLKVRMKTAPQKQWFIGREFRRRTLKTLMERDIQMWSPQRTVNLTPPKS